MATPTKIKEEFTPENLKDEYKKKLCNILPILKHNGLLELVIEYCNELKFYDKSNKESYIRETVLNEILRILINLRKEAINISKKKENRSIHIKKIEEITVSGLIEAIIQFTVKYYDNYITVSLSRLNINNEFMYISMNNANAVTLATYILDLYKRKDLSEYDKNSIFVNILKKIAVKLKHLQNICGFIHGDFHADNILIDEYENIYFIDFEYSIIRLPTKNNEKIILCGVKDVNLKRGDILDIQYDPKLKAIDMYHLIIYFEKLNENEYNHKINNILDQIKKICFDNKINNKNKKEYSKPHDYTSSYNFIKNTNNLEMLYPENFKNLKFSSNGTLAIIPLHNEELQPVQSLLINSSRKKRLFSTNNSKNNNSFPKKLTENNNSFPKKLTENNNSSPKKLTENIINSNENNYFDRLKF